MRFRPFKFKTQNLPLPRSLKLILFPLSRCLNGKSTDNSHSLSISLTISIILSFLFRFQTSRSRRENTAKLLLNLFSFQLVRRFQFQSNIRPRRTRPEEVDEEIFLVNCVFIFWFFIGFNRVLKC